MTLSENYKTWDVKLIWSVTFPSRIFAPGEISSQNFEIYGVDRSSINISRPLTRISSLEQGNQGYIDGIPDYRVTIFTKEAGRKFDQLRRLSAKKIPFDVSLTLASDHDNGQLEDNPHEGIWIDGYEEFLGCRVTGERTNYAIADFPLREFECMALRHFIKGATIKINGVDVVFDEIIEGDGTYETNWP
jgi:hypothetical protein